MAELTPEHVERLRRAKLSLKGLSIGDAFGQQFFSQPELLATRELPPPSWHITDDTVMAVSIVETLEREGRIEQNLLASLFTERYLSAPHRGYGGTAHGILRAIGEGTPRKEAAGDVFDGTGSMENGGAMRAGPIGAYYAHDLDLCVEDARRSAEVTHAHPEGQAGAIAIAVAAAATVPFCLWSAAKHIQNFEEAMWSTVSAFGDRDTTCAIVGSIVAMAVGDEGIPRLWYDHREPLNC